jgi:hypothetical protein
MKTTKTISIAAPFLAVFAGCGGGGSAPDAPKVLYLANDMVETAVKLVDTEPAPF